MTPPSARWHLCYSPAGPACFSLMPPDTDRLVFFSESDPAAHATCNPSLNAAVGAADTLSLLISYSPACRLPPAVQSSRALARPSHARPLTTNSPLLRRVAARQYCSGGARLAHPAPAHRVPGTCRKLPDLHRVASHSTAQHSIATADSASSSSPSGSFRLAAADLVGCTPPSAISNRPVASVDTAVRGGSWRARVVRAALTDFRAIATHRELVFKQQPSQSLLAPASEPDAARVACLTRLTKAAPQPSAEPRRKFWPRLTPPPIALLQGNSYSK